MCAEEKSLNLPHMDLRKSREGWKRHPCEGCGVGGLGFCRATLEATAKPKTARRSRAGYSGQPDPGKRKVGKVKKVRKVEKVKKGKRTAGDAPK